jgi:CRISPR system Cascade subunit CasE
MINLHLVRMVLDAPRLMRFAGAQGLLRLDDDGHGYVLHAWLAAVFGPNGPKPFRWNESRNELLGYSVQPAVALEEFASAFAAPQDWAVLEQESLASKPMPTSWRVGQRLQLEVLACPVTRRDDGEKDVFLRAVDRLGDDVQPRADVYAEWFRRQCGASITFEHLELAGHSRVRMVRRGWTPDGHRAARTVERPQALFRGVAVIENGLMFGTLLARGIGRHRAFGFGMVLLKPAL